MSQPGMPELALSRRRLGLCLVAGLVSGCAAVDQPLDEGPTGPPMLSPGDRIKITVFGEDQLTTEADIDSDGNITIPLLGPVKLAESAPRAVEKMVARQLAERKLVVDAKVAVAVLRYRPIYVLGEVARPGGYDYTSDLTVLNAIALAGGYTRRARITRVTVRHQGKGSDEQHLIAPTARLQPGDIIEVPERWF